MADHVKGSTGPILALYFDAPMQSWGCGSRYGRRSTGDFPTRSGVTGILCAALGIARDDTERIQQLGTLGMEILILERHLPGKKDALTMQRMMDYHTVGGGYDKNKENERMSIPRGADSGKPKGTVLTDREYLLDARFGVLLTGSADLLDKCLHALENPIWGIWFGRKCCIPASPVVQGTFATHGEAVQKLCSLSGCSHPKVLIQEVDFDTQSDIRSKHLETVVDLPVSFDRKVRSSEEAFIPRRISVEIVSDNEGP